MCDARCNLFRRQEMDSVAEIEMLDIQVEAMLDDDIRSDELLDRRGSLLCSCVTI
jgi:hypothetical protein